MKKLFILIIFLACSFSASASSPAMELFRTSWTPFQIGIWPFQLFYYGTTVNGVNINMSAGFQDKVNGITIAPISCAIEEHNGLAVGIVNHSWKNRGISFAVLSDNSYNYGISIGCINNNYIDKNFKTGSFGGVQIGAFNHAYDGLQIGLLNYNKNSALPWCPLFNYSCQDDCADTPSNKKAE